MAAASRYDSHISTGSVEDGLDFACQLLSHALQDIGPEEAPALLRALSQYLSFRYAGELGLALDHLASIANDCNSEEYRRTQFWAQLQWVADKMEYSDAQRVQLGFPTSELGAGGA